MERLGKYWAMEPDSLQAFWPNARAETAKTSGKSAPYQVHGNIAIVSITGVLTPEGWWGTSTPSVGHAVAEASRDSAIKGIMIYGDSPGGSVDDVDDTAVMIRRARERTRVYAHINNLGASACYWLCSQAERVTASRTSRVGSIGVYTVVTDLSQAAEREGVKVHVVGTGGMKGAFTPGTPITEEQLAELRTEVDGLNGHFLRAVRSGRQMTADTLKPLADGRVWLANDAAAHGLIDGVMSFDDAVKEFARDLRPGRREAAARKLRLA